MKEIDTWYSACVEYGIDVCYVLHDILRNTRDEELVESYMWKMSNSWMTRYKVYDAWYGMKYIKDVMLMVC